MRIASDQFSGAANDELTVIRGYLGSDPAAHLEGSLIRKIDVFATELRRPSILRGSGHTFEYLGYGPGNYSTGLPQVQDITLTEREEFLTQSQKRSGGVVVYTAMNNDGDTMFGASFTTSMSGMDVTIGGDVHSDNTSSADETALGVKATLGSLVVVANSVQKEAAAGVDVTTYSAAYTTGGLVIGFQGADNDQSAYSATYTIVPGMQFEIGSEDDGTTSTSSAQLQMTF